MCGDVFNFAVARFEVFKYAIALGVVRRKSLTVGEIVKIRFFSDCWLNKRKITF